MDSVVRLVKTYIQLCRDGCRLFLNWKVKFFFDRNRDVCCIVEFFQNQAQKLKGSQKEHSLEDYMAKVAAQCEAQLNDSDNEEEGEEIRTAALFIQQMEENGFSRQIAAKALQRVGDPEDYEAGTALCIEIENEETEDDMETEDPGPEAHENDSAVKLQTREGTIASALQLVQKLWPGGSFEHEYQLVIICTSENEFSARITAALERYLCSSFMPFTSREVCSFLHRNFLVPEDSTPQQSAACVDPERLSVRVVKSTRSGMGKTLYKKRLVAQLRDLLEEVEEEEDEAETDLEVESDFDDEEQGDLEQYSVTIPLYQKADFATRSTKVAEESLPVLTRTEREGDAEKTVGIEQFQLRRTWESRSDRLQRLYQVMGLTEQEMRDDDEEIIDPDDTYELTTDNVKKILAIYMRFRCNIPVIIMGETGHSPEVIERLEKAGLGYHVRQDQVGRLSPDQFDTVCRVLVKSQTFMRQLQDECSFVSLRDADRTLMVTSWFLKQQQLLHLIGRELGPWAQMVSFQCSPLATADGILATFRQCAHIQHGKDKDKFVAVAVLDEIGLAEDSPKMPLKALHPLLEDGCMVNNVQSENKVAFIGISNWALDPAKMNRGILVQRDVPDKTELVQTAEGICGSEDPAVLELVKSLVKKLAQAYLAVFNQATNRREFFGLRDFYSLVKMIHGIARYKKRKLTRTEFRAVILRNFGGLPVDTLDPVEVFQQHLSMSDICCNINQIKVCMETGKTVILLNLDNLYESLYDALNQVNNLAMTMTGHLLIVVAEKQTVYDKFPIPLINRLEKHFLSVNNIPTNEQRRLRWQQHATNIEVSRRTGISNIVDEAKRRRWSWLGHALRMNKTRHPARCTEMGTTREKEEGEADGHHQGKEDGGGGWAPPGGRKTGEADGHHQGEGRRGRRMGTTREKEEGEADGHLAENSGGRDEDNREDVERAQLACYAQDRDAWRRFVGALCSGRSEED
nr:hypothetical protein BaRGS_008126 [Batillaria attramentaria]